MDVQVGERGEGAHELVVDVAQKRRDRAEPTGVGRLEPRLQDELRAHLLQGAEVRDSRLSRAATRLRVQGAGIRRRANGGNGPCRATSRAATRRSSLTPSKGASGGVRRRASGAAGGQPQASGHPTRTAKPCTPRSGAPSGPPARAASSR